MRLLGAMLLVVVCGCGKSDEAGDRTAEKAVEALSGGKVKVKGNKVTIKTEKGTATFERDDESGQVKTKDATISFGKNELPKGFPLKLYAGSKIAQAMHAKPDKEPEAFQVHASVSAPLDKVAEFYEKALKGKGLEVKRTKIESDDTQMINLNGQAGKVKAVVMVNRAKDAAETTTSIIWSAE